MQAHLRNETFGIDGETLLRFVEPRRGKPYRHTCTLEIFNDLALTIETYRGSPFIGDDLVKSMGAPHSQVFTALAFLRERGCIVASYGRASRAADGFIYEDAMIEWHALREGAPGAVS